jgi:hypothetical protein
MVMSSLVRLGTEITSPFNFPPLHSLYFEDLYGFLCFLLHQTVWPYLQPILLKEAKPLFSNIILQHQSLGITKMHVQHIFASHMAL